MAACSIGYGVSCFLRTIVSYYVAMKNDKMILYLLKVIYLYAFISGLILSALSLAVSPYIGQLFYSDGKSQQVFKDCFQIFCLHFTLTYLTPVINTTYRFPLILYLYTNGQSSLYRQFVYLPWLFRLFNNMI